MEDRVAKPALSNEAKVTTHRQRDCLERINERLRLILWNHELIGISGPFFYHHSSTNRQDLQTNSRSAGSKVKEGISGNVDITIIKHTGLNIVQPSLNLICRSNTLK